MMVVGDGTRHVMDDGCLRWDEKGNRWWLFEMGRDRL